MINGVVINSHNKISLKKIILFCEENNIQFIDKDYTSNKTKHNWLCNKHNVIHKHSYDKLQQSKRLLCCAIEQKQTQTLPAAIEFAQQINLKFNVDDYKGSENLMQWTCSVHNYSHLTSFHRLRHSTTQKLSCCTRADKLATLEVRLNELKYELLDAFTCYNKQHIFYCNRHKQYRVSRPALLLNDGILRCCRGEQNSGINHPNFNHHISNDQRIKDRRSDQNKQWSIAVRKRDEYACVLCSYNRDCVAHHLNSYMAYPNSRIDINNGVTLCKACHNNLHKVYGKNTTRKQFQEFKDNNILR